MSADTPATDGRHRRSETSRDRIVTAMLALVAGGQIAPSAEQVAVRAGVGLRTVFRHFKDMETLYAAMTRTMSRMYEQWLVPYAPGDWQTQLHELAERRLATFEQLLPIKRAIDAHRHRSPAIQAEYARMMAVLRGRLASILPAAMAEDTLSFETLDLMLSFDAWQRLRGDQGLAVAPARALVLAAVERLIADTRR